MRLNELMEELVQWQRLGYGETVVLLMNLNTQEHEEVEEVNPIGCDGEPIKAIEIR